MGTKGGAGRGCGSRGTCKRHMRAQITFSFMVSAVMFVGLFIYIISTVFGTINPHFTAAAKQESEAYAYMISTLLLSSPGQWEDGAANGTDWENHPKNATSLGLAAYPPSPGSGSSYHRLSLAKIGNMSSMTNGEIRALLGEGHLYSFCIGSAYTQDCGILDTTGQAFDGVTVTRYAVMENGTETMPVRIILEVL